MNEKFELYAIVELFGHSKIAGHVTEQSIGVATFIRVDVIETKTQPKFTRLLNPAAIYAINPVTKEVADAMAERITAKPIDAWDVNEIMKKLQQQLPEHNLKPRQDEFEFETENEA